MNDIKCVIIESGTEEEIKRNVQYAILALRDCLLRNEAPFASHLLYTQVPGKGFVSDNDEDCIGRDAAIDAGLKWGSKADKTVVYQDLGVTNGMKYGIKKAKEEGRPIEYRSLPNFEKIFN